LNDAAKLRELNEGERRLTIPVDPALAAAGLPKLRWHDLRHVAASLLIAQGASVGHVSRLLGHASPAITLSTYAHEFAAAEHADRTRERMEQAFGEVLR
jgi:integrase